MNDKQEYYLYIKSHCEAPDYEDNCMAISKLQAANIFARRMNGTHMAKDGTFVDVDWSSKDLYRHIASEEEMNRPLSNYEKEMMH